MEDHNVSEESNFNESKISNNDIGNPTSTPSGGSPQSNGKERDSNSKPIWEADRARPKTVDHRLIYSKENKEKNINIEGNNRYPSIPIENQFGIKNIVNNEKEGKQKFNYSGMNEQPRQILNMLTGKMWEPLNWEHLYPNLVRIRSEGDGHCMLYSIVNAYHIAFFHGRDGDKEISRPKMLRSLRNNLADRLAEPADIENDPEGPTHYQILSRGQLSSISKEMPRYQLNKMQEELRSNCYLDNLYLEYISNILDKDIYILNGTTADVQMLGDNNHNGIYYKGRNSVVLLYLSNAQHYETIGIQKGQGKDLKIYTYFRPDHPFIEKLRNRMDYIVSDSKN